MFEEKPYKIYDNVFGLSAQMRIFSFLTDSNTSYNLGWHDRQDKSNLLYLHRFVSMDEMVRLQFFRSIKNTDLFDFVENRQFNPTKIVVNASFPGYHYVPHSHPGEYALVYYANLEWEEHWAGETIVYENDGKNANVCVPYTPNRMLLLDKDIPHALRPPTFGAPFYRFTISMFFN